MKVLFDETKFVVSKESGTVACIITAHIRPSSRQNSVTYFNFGDKSLINKFQVVGLAKCSKDDKFDEKVGKRIAESRAKSKTYEEGINRMKKMLFLVDVFGSDIEEQVNKLKKYRTKEKEHLDVLKAEN